jgi:hypothetical protein
VFDVIELDFVGPVADNPVPPRATGIRTFTQQDQQDQQQYHSMFLTHEVWQVVVTIPKC